MQIHEDIKKRILVLDGALGTMLQRQGLSEADFRGEEYAHHQVNITGVNEVLNVSKPAIVKNIHRNYLEAGADIITTNTFNANLYALEPYQLDAEVYRLNYEGAKIAKEAVSEFSKSNNAKQIYVAGTLGPTKKAASIAPDINSPEKRDVNFHDLSNAYRQQAIGLIDGGVDLLMIETVIDTLNAKAAILAIHEIFREKHIELPIMVSGSIDESGHNLSGQTVEAFFNALQPFNLFSIGLNCSFGADKMTPYLNRLAIKSTINVSAHPNAGLPNEFGEYEQSARAMAEQIDEYLENGWVNIVGGCCGTTPAHVKALKEAVKQYNPRTIMPHSRTTRLSGLQSLGVKESTRTIKIGERTTVSGSQIFKKHITENDFDRAMAIARQQIEAGADMINISLDDGMIDAKKLIPVFIKLLASEPDIAAVPFMIDSSEFEVIESALPFIQGKPIVNSLSLQNGVDYFKERAIRLRRFGVNIVAMAADEQGQADSYERKIEICQRIYDIWTRELNFPPEDLIFDPIVLAIGTGTDGNNNYAKDFIRAVQWIKQNLPYSKVIGGISNVSFGFRGNAYLQEAINSVFLSHAQMAGLDFAIVNPGRIRNIDDIPVRLAKAIEDVIFDQRKNATDRLIEISHKYTDQPKREKTTTRWRKQSPHKRVRYAVENGIDTYINEDIQALSQEKQNPVEIIEGPLLEALTQVGKGFEEGKVYLPQVIKSARVMNMAVEALKPQINRSQGSTAGNHTGRILLATVAGDVHDIGKNILSLVLSSNMFEVIDLGVMVEKEAILHAVAEKKPDIIALSGLITPSLNKMTEVLQALDDAHIKTPVMVGGATTSKLHTAIKMAPHYLGLVMQCNDASKSASSAIKLVSDEVEHFINAEQADQKKIRDNYLRRKAAGMQISFTDARKKRFRYNYHEKQPMKPKMLGTKVFEHFDLNLLRKHIDWTPFFHGWGLKGVFPSIFEKDKVGKEAKRVFDEAQDMLNEIIDEKLLQPRGIIGLYPANADKDDILIFEDDRRSDVYMRIPMLRQQFMKNKQGEALSLTDYLAPVEAGIEDYFGGFAVTTGHGSEKQVERFKKKGDSYNSIMFRLISDRLVEAFAEVLHQWVRKKYWGYEPHEDLSKEELIKEKYKGIRPAPGYPACPDHSLKKYLFDLMQVEEKIGITLTESFAMHPVSSVAGFYMAHDASKYFGIGKIGRDQVEDYAKRANIKIKDAEKLLSSVLDYKT